MLALIPLALALTLPSPPSPSSIGPSEAELAFEALTGAELVWSRDALPDDVLFDRTPELPAARRAEAARILLDEAAKYPPRYFARMGLTRIGVFAACVSDTGDGFRPYDDDLGGYRYFGQWAPGEGRGALIAAFYSAGQLPQTFHHEVFHHVDATVAGKVDYTTHFKGDDARFAAALEGKRRYKAPALAADIVKSLSEVAGRQRLAGDNGDYAKKSAGEDQAEAARWFMTYLPEALVQVVRTPELAGSQRLLHLLSQYAGATRIGTAADVDWFVGRALGLPAVATQVDPAPAEDTGPEATRRWLEDQAARARAGRPTASADRIARLTVALTRDRIRPEAGDTRFTVWTPARYQGGPNTQLQADVRAIGADAARLSAWAAAPAAARRTLAGAQDELERLLVGYRDFVEARWGLSGTTAAAFEGALSEARGARLAGATTIKSLDNPHLAKVDAAIADPAWRALIRGVQPAAVKVGNGSGVNLARDGLVLTNAHVAENVGDVLTVTFPDGARFRGETIASDHHADLALVRLVGAPKNLPLAPVARRAPVVGDDLVAIGQPGRLTPSGEPTGYQGWHVSLGAVRGFRDDLCGDQSLGRLKHSAWTYWGHSGSPLFDRRGAIAGLHNSWDSKTAMRHGVPHEVIVRFLDAHDVAFTRR
ncbi:MAG: trypsin-like peptidase domain-containing protein [Deltaproteobacteria bacterium]|nr:trypsin-like peptidase domain-containing protein [Deltaproteobacteria bacterium]